MAVAVVVALEAVDIDHDDRDGLAITLRLLPHAADLVLERGAVEQRRETVVRGDLGEQPVLEERRAIRVLERVRAREADEVRGEQREQQVGRRRGRYRRGERRDRQRGGAVRQGGRR